MTGKTKFAIAAGASAPGMLAIPVAQCFAIFFSHSPASSLS
jgi:hypothetical protein